jgi:hypothetical protein
VNYTEPLLSSVKSFSKALSSSFAGLKFHLPQHYRALEQLTDLRNGHRKQSIFMKLWKSIIDLAELSRRNKFSVGLSKLHRISVLDRNYKG